MILRCVFTIVALCLPPDKNLPLMKTITLLFSTKKLLLEFYYTLENVAFAIDLKKLIITAAFSPTDILIAVIKYDADVLTPKNAHLLLDESIY